MKKLGYLILVFGLLITTACKEKTQQQETDQAEDSTTETSDDVDKTEEYFTLTMDATVEKDDEFVLYYLTEEQKAISKNFSVPVKVTGSPDIQQIRFRLKDNTLPMKLIIRFAEEVPDQKVTFMDAKINYKSSEFVIDAPRFFQFFNPNECIIFNKEDNSATVKAVNGRLNPSFNSRQVLEQKIDLLF